MARRKFSEKKARREDERRLRHLERLQRLKERDKKERQLAQLSPQTR